MRFLSTFKVLELHHRLIEKSKGIAGVRDFSLLESALAQPRMTFDGSELYPTLEEKAVALAFSLIKNHPFVDGNKRIGHAVMEVFLVQNGFEIHATTDDQEATILKIASGELSREDFVDWLRSRLVPTKKTKP